MAKIELGINKETGLSGIAHEKHVKMSEIKSQCETSLRKLVADYPEMEIATFEQQIREALAWQAGSSADCPLLLGIAEERGLTLAEMSGKVLAKAAAFTAASARLIGQRQKLADQLANAGTVEAVRAIEASYQEA